MVIFRLLFVCLFVINKIFTWEVEMMFPGQSTVNETSRKLYNHGICHLECIHLSNENIIFKCKVHDTCCSVLYVKKNEIYNK